MGISLSMIPFSPWSLTAVWFFFFCGDLLSRLLFQEEWFLWKSNTSSSFDIVMLWSIVPLHPLHYSEGLRVGLILGAEDLVGDKVDGSLLINWVCNPSMIGSIRSHYRPLMLIAPPLLLIDPVVVLSPMFPYLPGEAFSDLCLIFFVRYITRLGTLLYNADDDLTMLSPPMISRTSS